MTIVQTFFLLFCYICAYVYVYVDVYVYVCVCVSTDKQGQENVSYLLKLELQT